MGGPLKVKSGIWRAIFSPLRGSWVSFTVGAVATSVHAAASLWAPLVSKQVIDQVIVERRSAEIPRLAAELVLVAIAVGVGVGVRKYEANRITARLGYHYRTALIKQVLNLPVSELSRYGPGDITSHITSDVAKVELLISDLHHKALRVVTGFAGLAILSALQPWIGAVVALWLIGALKWSHYLSAGLAGASKEMQARIGHFSRFVEQQVRGIRVVKGFGLEETHLRQADSITSDLYNTGLTLIAIRSRVSAALAFVPPITSAITLGLAAWFGHRGSLTPGEIVAILHYLGLILSALPVANEILTVFPQAWAGMA